MEWRSDNQVGGEWCNQLRVDLIVVRSDLI